MTNRTFDLAGVAALIALAAVVWTDRAVLFAPRRTLDVTVSEAERAAGFREGTAWYLVRIADEPAGHARIDRRRLGHGVEMTVTGEVRVVLFDAAHDVGLSLRTRADRSLVLESFDVELTTDLLDLEARGVVSGDSLELEVSTMGVERRSRVPLDAPPVADVGIAARLLRDGPAPGDRFEIPTFDPFGLALRSLEVEYVGIERVVALDGMVRCHHLRQYFEGQVADVWVNDLGEVVRQQLPYGLWIERATEAEALAAASAVESADLGGALSDLSGATR